MATNLPKKRKELRSELGQIERQIYDLETSYLEETKEFGNIFTGWEGYLSRDRVKLRKGIMVEDRLFSLSSVTSPASRREDLKKAGAVPGTTPAKRGRKKKASAEGEHDAVGESVNNEGANDESKSARANDMQS